MRVLVVTTWFPSQLAPGNGIFNLRDTELLAEDHDVTVLHLIPSEHFDTVSQVDDLDNPSFDLQRLPYQADNPASILHVAGVVRRLSKSHDLIHSMAFKSIFPIKMAHAKIPWVHTEHWSGLMNRKISLKARIAGRVLPLSVRARLGGVLLFPELRHPNVVVAVGSELGKAIDRYRADRSSIIGNAVKFPEDSALPCAPEMRGKAALKLVAVGNLIHAKGPMPLIDAIAVLRRGGIEASLVWAGVGNLESEIRAKAEALDISDLLQLVGYVRPELLPDVLRDAHMFVLPTAQETFGIAIAEALACGLPVVSSGVGGHIGFLPARASRVVDVRDGASLAAAIQDLASDPMRWSGSEIQQYARSKFSARRRKEQYREIYDNARRRAQV